ncbi:MAG: hypothetical protein NVSMB17_06180 [Candidatus Dormibacteria bacterium]
MNSPLSKARLWGLLATLCVVAACSPSARPTATVSASPSATAKATAIPIDSAPETQAKAWRALDVSVIPPKGYAQDIHLTQEVLNHTGGRIDDATARRWAEDYLRSSAWSVWGTEHLQVDGFFNHLSPGDSVTQQAIYGDNYGWIDRANKGGGTLRQIEAAVDRVTVIVVADSVKSELTTTYGYPPIPEFALVIEQRGPASVVITYPDGRRETPSSLPATYRETGFIAGEVKQFPNTLGEIWFAHTYLGCAKNAFLRAACGS